MFKRLTAFGKIYFGFGIIFLVLGIFLFVENNVPIKEQYISISFFSLGIASILAAYLAKKQ
ncbi:hypothetical protein [Ornithinibacillus scapharcae]|uniref:hypothetical protein n=1 Tax=Ornithinibacillus scapharcae TaxID=1147159 RepID=UPI000225BA6E|nr:hypothetical protein [Ornithinibacillus scapharcae]